MSLPVQYTVPFFLVLVLLEYWYERKNSQRKTYDFSGTISNLSVGMVETTIGVFTHLAILLAYDWQFQHWAGFSWSAGNPLLWLGAFMLYEWCYYWKHRLGHEVNFMWAGHAVHHQSEEMNFSTGTRLSGTSPLYDVFFYIPMAVLGVPPLVYIACKAISLTYQLFLHTEHLRRLPSWAEYILNTPAHHRVHHSCHPEHLDKNYGSMIILYDRWYGTFAPELQAPVYGLTRPLDSLNPVSVNLAHYKQLFSWLSMARNAKDYWSILLGRPAGLPTYLPQHAQRSAERKMRPKDSKAFRRYAGSQLLPACLFAFFLLRHFEDNGLLLNLSWILLILWYCWALGQLLDHGIGAHWRQEIGRQLSYWAIAPTLFVLGAISGAALAVACLSLVVSGWWCWCAYVKEIHMT